MANAGNTFTITLKRPHLEWGSHRYTDSRGIVYGEGYIPIKASDAYNFNLLNQNGTNYEDIFGLNLFNCVSVDGRFRGVLRAQGTQSDDHFAKQLAGDKDLKALGDWFYAMGATIGDQVKVTWTSSTDIEIELL